MTTMDRLEAANVNHAYFVHYIKRIHDWKCLKVLDFGCGNGEILKLLRQEGIDAYGVDVFYEGASYEALYKTELFQQGIIRKITENGDIPFEDGYFDVIISNQVFEHIQDKGLVLDKLKRVLKQDGFMYHHFPSREVIREGHIGIPCVHWLPKGKLRYIYTVILRSIGLGYFKNGLSVSEWAKEKLDWVDKYCFYEKYADLYRLINKDYSICHREIDYCRFRARNNAILKFILDINLLKGFYEYLFRQLAFMAIELKK